MACGIKSQIRIKFVKETAGFVYSFVCVLVRCLINRGKVFVLLFSSSIHIPKRDKTFWCHYPLFTFVRHILLLSPIFKFLYWQNNARILCVLCMVTVTTRNIHTKSFHKSIIFMCNGMASESIQTTQLSKEYTDLFVPTTAINIRIAQCVFCSLFFENSSRDMGRVHCERIVANRFSLD